MYMHEIYLNVHGHALILEMQSMLLWSDKKNKWSLTRVFQVFLQHLSPLLSLSTFTALWLTILDFMDKYMHADKSDLLVSGLLLQYLSQESNMYQ